MTVSCACILALCMLCGGPLRAQVKTSVRATGRHKSALGEMKRIKSEAERRKRQLGEYREIKALRKACQSRFDSLKKEHLRAYRSKKQEAKKAWRETKRRYGDSLRFDFPAYRFTKEDSTELAGLVADRLQVPGGYLKYLQGPLPGFKDYRPKNIKQALPGDSAVLARGEALLAKATGDHVPKELKGKASLQGLKAYQEGLKKGFSKDSAALARGEALLAKAAEDHVPKGLKEQNPLAAEGLTAELKGKAAPGEMLAGQVDRPLRPNPNLISPESAKALFKKVDPGRFAKIQEGIAGQKKKYSAMPDSRYPEEAKKRNSLEGAPPGKRLSAMGNADVKSTDPLILATNLKLGYWMDKKWLLGVGIIYQEQFGGLPLAGALGDSHGYGLFTSYRIKGAFFGWGELERQAGGALFSREKAGPGAKWQTACLLGIGREFSLGPVRMAGIVAYDLNYRNNTVNQRPLAIKMGFRFTKPPF